MTDDKVQASLCCCCLSLVAACGFAVRCCSCCVLPNHDRLIRPMESMIHKICPPNERFPSSSWHAPSSRIQRQKHTHRLQDRSDPQTNEESGEQGNAPRGWHRTAACLQLARRSCSNTGSYSYLGADRLLITDSDLVAQLLSWRLRCIDQ